LRVVEEEGNEILNYGSRVMNINFIYRLSFYRLTYTRPQKIIISLLFPCSCSRPLLTAATTTLADVLRSTDVPISYCETAKNYNNYWREQSASTVASLGAGVKKFKVQEFPGIKRLKQTYADFNGALENWLPYQSDVFDQMVNANAHIILGEDYSKCISFVMEHWCWKTLLTEVLMLAYRGCGKSTLLVGAAASFIKNIPNYNAMIYSGNMDKGSDLIDNIAATLEYMMGKDEDFSEKYRMRRNKKVIMIYSLDGKDKRFIRAASSISKNVSRGWKHTTYHLLRSPRIFSFLQGIYIYIYRVG
jgi:hypothetical protein